MSALMRLTREDPFRITPHENLFHPLPEHTRLRDAFGRALAAPGTVAVLTGEAGTGKTMVARRVLADAAERGRPIRVLTTGPGATVAGLLDAEPPAGALLLVDEAHWLPPDELGALAATLDAGGASALLSGQARLADALAAEAARPLREKVQAEGTLSALDPEEVAALIDGRLRVSGWTDPSPFEPDALRLVAHRARGLPRLVNTLAGNALVLAAIEDDERVTAARVDEAAGLLGLPQPDGPMPDRPAETGPAPMSPSLAPPPAVPTPILTAGQERPVPPRRPPVRWIGIPAALAAAGALGAVLWWPASEPLPTPAPVAPAQVQTAAAPAVTPAPPVAAEPTVLAVAPEPDAASAPVQAAPEPETAPPHDTVTLTPPIRPQALARRAEPGPSPTDAMPVDVPDALPVPSPPPLAVPEFAQAEVEADPAPPPRLPDPPAPAEEPVVQAAAPAPVEPAEPEIDLPELAAAEPILGPETADAPELDGDAPSVEPPVAPPVASEPPTATADAPGARTDQEIVALPLPREPDAETTAAEPDAEPAEEPEPAQEPGTDDLPADQAESDIATAPSTNEEDAPPASVFASLTPPDPLAALRSRAAEQMSRLALTTPPGDNALETLQEILARAPDDPEATAALRRMTDLYVEWARSAAARDDTEQARTYLGRALTVSPDDPEVSTLLAELDRPTPEPEPEPETVTVASSLAAALPPVTRESAPNSSGRPIDVTRSTSGAAVPAPSVAVPARLTEELLSRPDDLRAALRSGADPDSLIADGKTALMVAAERGWSRAAAVLLDQGASPNIRNAAGGTALMYAAFAGDSATVRTLLRHGAAPGQRNPDGKTALMAAALSGDPDTVQALIEAGAPLDARTIQGWTPLMYAAWAGHGGAAAVLVRNGADPRLRNEDGETAADIARARGYGQFAALF